jgi:hypothetical protein
MTSSLGNIFFNVSSAEKSLEEKKLFITLTRAGFQFLDSSRIIDGKDFFKNLDAQIAGSGSSIHFIGEKKYDLIDGVSIDEYAFTRAAEKIDTDKNFKTFIWMPADYNYLQAGKQQIDFINKIQNNLSGNITLSRVPYHIQFVEDVRLVLEQNVAKVYPTQPADIFIIFNQTDEVAAARITGMLSAIVKLVKLVIVQDADIDYEEFASQQISASKLCVIFYQSASPWALPFVQQIWKKIGGASSNTQILLIGDAATTSVKFSAPKVTTASVPYELIPLEIKVQFDKVNEQL